MQDNNYLVAGVDEVGRGCLAGPVVAAAVVLQDGFSGEYVDSKQLSHKKRGQLVQQLYKGDALAIGIGCANAAEIDAINILQATFVAMHRALHNLETSTQIKVDALLIDGNMTPGTARQEKAIIKGDKHFPCIAAASIVAKVYRDQWMSNLANQYPAYGFEKHKGYGTKYHQEALQAHGPCSIHRKSFSPVHALLKQPGLFDTCG